MLSPPLPSSLRYGSPSGQRRDRVDEKAPTKVVTGDVLAKLLATRASDSLHDLRDQAILMVAFPSADAEPARLPREQLTVEPLIIVENDPPLPSLAIHLGPTKKSGAEDDVVVHLTRRSVETLNAWMEDARSEISKRYRQAARHAGRVGYRRVFGEWSALGLSDLGCQSRHPLPEEMEQSRVSALLVAAFCHPLAIVVSAVLELCEPPDLARGKAAIRAIEADGSLPFKFSTAPLQQRMLIPLALFFRA